jgi:hypothetical protein
MLCEIDNSLMCHKCGKPAIYRDSYRTCTTEGLVPRKPAPPPCGPGCQLKKTLEWWRIRDDGSCGCGEYAAQMDAWGPDGCEAKIDEIVAHLLEQAAKRNVFLGAVPAVIVVPIVRSAIAAARQAQKNAPS